MPADDTVRLLINGASYEGWQTVQVERSLESLTGSFNVTVTERWAGQAIRWPIRPDDRCQISFGRDLVMTGIVDRVNTQLTDGDHTLTLAGRGTTSNLVDCSAEHEPGEWDQLKLDELAKILGKPFGISVSTEADVGELLKKVKIQPGETSWETLERYARQRGILPITNGDGSIALVRAGSGAAATALIEGQNLLEVSAEWDNTERYGKYTVRGQSQGSDDFFGNVASEVQGQAFDRGVSSNRPLLILSETATDGKTSQQRAEWEATVRAAKSQKVQGTVQGWRQGNGALWPLNGRSLIKSPSIGLNEQLLISRVAFSLDESGGTRTQLDLMRPDAFKPQPEIPEGTNLWETING